MCAGEGAANSDLYIRGSKDTEAVNVKGPSATHTSSTMTEFIVRIYENGARRYLKEYDHFALNALAKSLREALGDKPVEIGRTGNNKEIVIMFAEKTELENSLIRVKPENLLTHTWAEYVQLQLLDPKDVAET
jgi:hypothetical protein